MSVLMLFLDGIGVGARDPEINPFARFPTPYFPLFQGDEQARLPFDGTVIPIDPTMDMPGLPQSATGQTALLTGVNSARELGRHLSGFPTVSLRKIISKHSIFKKIEEMGKVGTFANAFTPEYFQREQRRISATTRSVQASGFPFRMLKPELWDERAISHDLTNEFMRSLGHDAPIRTPDHAARILTTVTGEADFCLFEYFLSDMIGHRQDFGRAKHELQKLRIFLDTLLAALDLKEITVLLTSDHGNLEDLSVATHTRNFVPASVWGKSKAQVLSRLRRIEDVPVAILEGLGA